MNIHWKRTGDLLFPLELSQPRDSCKKVEVVLMCFRLHISPNLCLRERGSRRSPGHSSNQSKPFNPSVLLFPFKLPIGPNLQTVYSALFDGADPRILTWTDWSALSVNGISRTRHTDRPPAVRIVPSRLDAVPMANPSVRTVAADPSPVAVLSKLAWPRPLASI